MNLHALHLGLVFAWLGVLGTEGILELLAYRRPELRRAAALLHFVIDLVLELPLLFAILGTGLALLHGHPTDARLALKVGASAVAIGLNLVCVAIVVLRHRGSSDRIEARSRIIHALIFLGVPAGAVALYLGLGYAGLWP